MPESAEVPQSQDEVMKMLTREHGMTEDQIVRIDGWYFFNMPDVEASLALRYDQITEDRPAATLVRRIKKSLTPDDFTDLKNRVKGGIHSTTEPFLSPGLRDMDVLIESGTLGLSSTFRAALGMAMSETRKLIPRSPTNPDLVHFRLEQPAIPKTLDK